MADTKALPLILDRLARHEDGLKPVVILDAGFASRANLALLKERGYSYIVNITRGSRSKYADAFEKETFEALPGRSEEQRVEVKKITDPEDSASHFVLCRSAQRRIKEEAMISRAEKRFLPPSSNVKSEPSKNATPARRGSTPSNTTPDGSKSPATRRK